MSASAPLRQRSYFAAGEKNSGEHYNASVAVNPFRYGRNSNYEPSNAGNGGNSLPPLRIPKAKHAGEIIKNASEFNINNNNNNNNSSIGSNNSGGFYLQSPLKNMKNSAEARDTMKELFEDTLFDISRQANNFTKGERDSIGESVLENVKKVYEDETHTLQLPKESSIGYAFVRAAIDTINRDIPASNRMNMFGVFQQVVNDVDEEDDEQNDSNSGSNANQRRSRKTRRQRQQRQQRKTRRQRRKHQQRK